MRHLVESLDALEDILPGQVANLCSMVDMTPKQNPFQAASLNRVRQIVCPVIPGTPKSVVGPLDILPGCSVGTLDLALAASVNVTAVMALSQIRDGKRWRRETIITTDVRQ